MATLHYISAIHDRASADQLNQRMVEYYRTFHQYYDEIDFAVSGWNDPKHLLFQDIAKRCKEGNVCEIGCGAAGILRSKSLEEVRYAGCDFSESLLDRNRQQFPRADFRVIQDSTTFPFESHRFDLVFSICVLEHVVYPQNFLKELVRLCRVGGTIIILCPDFYSRLGITSQVAGTSGMSGRQKLARGQWLDAMKTLWISRVLMPSYLRRRLRNAHIEPVFLLNADPACFHQKFYPDADAVYVTHEGEIETTMRRAGAEPKQQGQEIKVFAKEHRMIYSVYQSNGLGTNEC